MLQAGRNPDAEGRRLPRGLGEALDLDRIGMYGHSAGGITAAETMRVDRRIDAGINMDGTLQHSGTEYLPVALEGLDRPFMLMGKASQTHLIKPSWQSFWDRSTGWKRDLSLELGGHFSYTDTQTIVPALDDTWTSRRRPASSSSAPGTPSAVPQPSVPTSRRSSTSTCWAGHDICWTSPPRRGPKYASFDERGGLAVGRASCHRQVAGLLEARSAQPDRSCLMRRPSAAFGRCRRGCARCRLPARPFAGGPAVP
ncbi:hypothetical protein OG920_43265 [Streptomyces europaeiscabiei]|uniref:hypothetical protein n=1 Tax=Streptomyces TaxID=1883 RepID=UPI00211AF86A|nr:MULTISPECIES: hypothetical protein [Streptomyces]MDX3585019.1 hypothetical protein [Streptomyces europaeiscabiei]MDX3612070.1 hypothetical protein [Streptomyces europaeiscabiei]MDX3635133.1 hypothetical protein [Streptomyces europaeiscabiei]MDX3650117.1 hypothetical protein [Streptomyces europaeiscabiei]WUD37696.1 hypothetical protein OG858_43990 [Streptomyces europaeiscabiei]